MEGSTHVSEADVHSIPASVIRKVMVASFVGNFVEWYDYAVYGYLASIIAVVFFPESNPTAGLLMAYGVFAISFIIRPLGGLFWGSYGDRVGRRGALAWSILIMSGATFVIAFLPTYKMVGMLSPGLLLLVRIVQGFSASGEYGGASTFLTEYAPKGKRGLYASVVPASTAAGLLFGALLIAVMTGVFSDTFMETWGWRLPFLLALPLGYIGRYIRLKLEDTPLFTAEMDKHDVPSTPLKELFRGHWKAIVVGFLVTLLNAVGFYLVLSYLPTYLAEEVGVSDTQAFWASTIQLALYIFFIFGMGMLSDRWGRKKVLIMASIMFAVFTVPIFMILGNSGFFMIVVGECLLALFLCMNDGTLPSFLCEIFPTHVRYSGFAFVFNSGNALFGGTAPFIATALIAATGNKLMPAWYLVGAALIAGITMLFAKETSKISLTAVKDTV